MKNAPARYLSGAFWFMATLIALSFDHLQWLTGNHDHRLRLAPEDWRRSFNDRTRSIVARLHHLQPDVFERRRDIDCRCRRDDDRLSYWLNSGHGRCRNNWGCYRWLRRNYWCNHWRKYGLRSRLRSRSNWIGGNNRCRRSNCLNHRGGDHLSNRCHHGDHRSRHGGSDNSSRHFHWRLSAVIRALDTFNHCAISTGLAITTTTTATTTTTIASATLATIAFGIGIRTGIRFAINWQSQCW